jgi:hypothetical protein
LGELPEGARLRASYIVTDPPYQLVDLRERLCVDALTSSRERPPLALREVYVPLDAGREQLLKASELPGSVGK